MTAGEEAERFVTERIRAAFPETDVRVYPNVSWVAPTRDGGPAVDGEADLVIAHPEWGVLVLEVKAGAPSRDASGTWWLGPHRLDRSPFAQAETSKHALLRKVTGLPAWPTGRRPYAGHAVAFPDADLDSLPRGHVLLGPEAPREIVIDGTALETPDATRAALERAFRYWRGDGARGDPPGAAGIALLDDLLVGERTLRRLLRGRIEDDRPVLHAATEDQRRILNQNRRARRLEIVGPAGSGKSMLALEKARRLAGEGFRTLLVCFNQRLAAELIRETADVDAPAGLIVTTFHRLCERLGTEAGLLPPRPREPIPAEWWNETLPGALERGCAEGRIERFDAVIVDEGQDFDLRWLRALAGLLPGSDDGILWVFHDPGQAVLRDDPVGSLGLPVVELHENLRNPASVAELSARFYVAGETVSALRDDGGPRHRIVIAEPGEPTLVALRKELHRLVQEEQVPGFRIAVLVGCSMSESEVWRRGEFGNELLVNEAFHDDGRLKGLPPEHLPEEPSEILCETIRRFKGLEREVVILVELNPATPRLDQVLYAGLTRATTHLTVIAPPELEGRLRGGAAGA